ncbi:MAG TPA: 7-cyano-7-deazaguanine synthase [Candidatus Binataceae bacterium]
MSQPKHPRFQAHQYQIAARPREIAVLASGGLDSSVLLATLAANYRRVHPIYVRAGLYWEQSEICALSRFVSAMNSPRVESAKVLELPMFDVSGPDWTTTGQNPPGYRAAVESNYIVGRNLTLLAKAAVYCVKAKIGELAMAPLQANPFPDARRKFFAAFEKAVELGTGLRLRIVTPFAVMTKAEVIALGLALPLQFTITCVRPRGFIHCGACTKCAERIAGFRAAGVVDPTRYATAGKPREAAKRPKRGRAT